MGRDSSLAQPFRWHAYASKRGEGESNNRGAAIAAEFVGGRDDPAKRRGDGHTVQFRQHRVRGRAVTVPRNDHRYLCGGEAALGRFATPLARLRQRPTIIESQGTEITLTDTQSDPTELVVRVVENEERMSAAGGAARVR